MINIRHLVWDDWNVEHIARHQVTRDEAEEVCHGNPVVQEGKKGRILVFGPSHTGRMLAVVLDQSDISGVNYPPGVYYPVTARPASRQERAIYTQERKGGEQA